MEHFHSAIAHSKLGFIGTIVCFALAVVGKFIKFLGNVTLGDVALIIGIASGGISFLFTCWKWRQEWVKAHRKHYRHEK